MQGLGHLTTWRGSEGLLDRPPALPSLRDYLQLGSKHKGLEEAFVAHNIKSLMVEALSCSERAVWVLGWEGQGSGVVESVTRRDC